MIQVPVVVSSFHGENVLFFHCMKASVLYYIPTKYSQTCLFGHLY